ncbi:hypothetical protein GGX14DRAFT_572922 [Mycena pura]|uniref:RRM domain-containing protein n=1 Tax=Mycena pura TaxID=153505 RepID=A0AAD6UZZ7_9AGAR|nr:hypothetical protein GGX14DRAFT_572922 [Mycena pura]
MFPSRGSDDSSRPIPRPLSLRLAPNRLSSQAGWREFPAVHAGLGFTLHGLFSLSSRVVVAGQRVFQLWSPNSVQSPFYPGIADPSFEPLAALPSGSRRSDGSLGRFDPTVAPQLYRAATPYWGFVRRAELVQPTDPNYPFFAPITQFWRDSGVNRGGQATGILSEDFVNQLARRGQEMSAQGDTILAELPPNWRIESLLPPSVQGLSIEIGRLRVPSLYQDALDTCARVQRALQLRLAWTEWMPLFRQAPSNATLLRLMITAAEEAYMGFWLNGGDERMSLVLMHLRVPGFVLHEFMSGETNVPTSSLRDFLEDSTTASSTSPYDEVVGVRADSDGWPTDVQGSALLPSRDELWMSSSWFAQGPQERGAPRPMVIPPTSPVLSEPPQHPPARTGPSPPTVSMEDDSSDYGDRSPITPMANEETEWIQPPDIQAAPSSSSAWQRWSYDEDQEAFVLLGKHNKNVRGKAYFDRSLHRKLFIIGHVIPDGVWDLHNFGLPVPQCDFPVRSGNKWISKKRSQWMYVQERPSDTMPAGTAARIPPRTKKPVSPEAAPPEIITVEAPLPMMAMGAPLLAAPVTLILPVPSRSDHPELPREAPAPELSREDEEEEPIPSHKGKGKAKAVVEDEEMEEGEIDTTRERAPSTVVTVEGLPTDMDVHDYLAAVSEELYHAGAVVSSAMNGQRRMWLEFFDSEAAERARSALPSAGGAPGVTTSFATTGEFEEHWPYTHSQWQRARSPSPRLRPPASRSQPKEPEDDMVSLGSTPPPDDCLMVDYPDTSGRRSPSPQEMEDLSPSEPVLTNVSVSPTVPEVPSGPRKSTIMASEQFNEEVLPRRGGRAREEFPQAPTFHDAPIWGVDSTNGGRHWLDDMLELPTRPALEYRLRDPIEPRRIPPP